MFDAAKFYASIRTKTGPLTAAQIVGTDAVLAACEGLPLAHTAYVCATSWHETNGKMMPVREAYWLSENWRRRNLARYFPWYGRGMVQITWEVNYQRADMELAKAGIIERGALMRDLDLALRPDIAAFITRRGMTEGWFAGDRTGRHTLARHLPMTGTATRAQYIQARRIINGLDKADLVEDYAQWFERALRDGGWPQK